jgi:hypothetical protein
MIFTIDIDNDIRVHETEAQAEDAINALAGTIVVRSEKELAKATSEWPASRLVELWNSFAGVALFTDCKPVKKFENRDKAVARIWATIQRLGNTIAPKPPQEAPSVAETKKSGKPKAAKGAQPTSKGRATESKKAETGKSREGTHKAEVIAMMQRKAGATLEDIVKATGWQKHTVRGFISILGGKGGMKINSSRREGDGARVYEAQRQRQD